MKKIKVEMTDDAGHFWLGGKLYKMKRYLRGSREGSMKGVHRAEYVEVDPKEYDNRIELLTKRIASFPNVDLLDVLRDALYDMPLKWLGELEGKLDKEEARAKQVAEKPKVESKRGERGTCVELRVGDKFAMDMRI